MKSKLVYLLNEYDPYIQSDGTYTDNFWWYVSQGNSAIFPKEVGINKIISNEYGFIKWLVDNDKINIKYLKFEYEYIFPIRKNFDQMGTEDSEDYTINESIIMILSIQKKPINFLISILK